MGTRESTRTQDKETESKERKYLGLAGWQAWYQEGDRKDEKVECLRGLRRKTKGTVITQAVSKRVQEGVGIGV